MKYFSSLAYLAGLTASASAFSKAEQDAALALAALKVRALPNAPNGYTPSTVDCPDNRPQVRLANSLSQQEKDFLSARREKTVPAMKDFLGRAGIKDFDVNNYFSSHSNSSQLPTVGIAISGGGYRALMNGAGVIQAFDGREANATASGHLGGLLQSATYVSRLSGGSWLVGSIYVNNFTTISNLTADSSRTWHFEDSIFKGPDHGIQILSSADYYKTIYEMVQDKTKNYSTTITDYWGRALSYQFVNATDGGPSFTWSSISQNPGFSNGDQPFPIVVADSRRPGQKIISGNSSVYEFNPYEFGTWDPAVYSFAPLEYIGGNFSNGTVPSDQKCVRGFDNAGFVMGTSSSLFNSFLLNIANNSDLGAPDFIVKALEGVLTDISDDEEDIASYEPHPFYNWNPTGKSAISNDTQLTLVDGGLDGQNIPLHPLIQPERAVDAIFAVDSSADTDYAWPNGTSLVATYERALNPSGVANGTSFPAIPDQNTFVNLGLNTRPTFFGCDAANTSTTTPLVVYLPNSPYVYFSNWTTFTPSYNTSERDNSILNGYYVATRANGTADPEWPACVGCAMLSRSFNRTGTSVPAQCQSCFQRYCWNGTLASQAPSGKYEPKVANASAEKKSAAVSLRADGGVVWSTALVAVVAVVFFGLA